ncbi:hypothetical protein FACS1894152_7620 [Bacilli bacterium]|nr:hypothetical protein FACS1894152_7620 [Bacilli bacterium]
MVKLTAKTTKVTGDENGKVTKSTKYYYGGNFSQEPQEIIGKNGNAEVSVRVYTILFSRSR